MRCVCLVILLLSLSLSVFGRCSSSYIDESSGSTCVQPCDGSGALYLIEFDDLNITPYPLSQSSETTLSLRFRSHDNIEGFGVDFKLESSPFFFLNQEIIINNFCEEYDLPAAQCSLSKQDDWTEISIPFTIPSGPLVFPGTYCGRATFSDLSGNLLSCLGFHFVITA